MAKAKKTSAGISETSMNFLRTYMNTASPVGAESNGQKVWLNYIKRFVDSTFTDPYGTAVGVINNDGFIYLKRNGGVDQQIAPSQRVIIHGKNGPVKAVFGWPAIHTRSGNDDKEQKAKVENLFLDCGARNKKEVEDLGIHVGAVVTYTEGFDEIANGNLIGRAFDNRIGGFMIAEVARLLKENKKTLPYSLYVVNAVQEEIGLRGAEMIARRI